ncbi:MAG: alkaline phosphatase, partial [Pseudomonadota bacterium]
MRQRIARAGLMLAGFVIAAGCAMQTAPAARIAAAGAIDLSIRHRFEVSANTGKARNVILFVGDGMGVATVTAARIFDGQSRGEPGEENVLSFERLPHLALIKTYNTNQQVSDSAGTATAMLTGIKTRAGVIAVGPEPRRRDCPGARGQELTTIVDLAERRGLATGIVTTTRITHATPASAYAHSSERDFENDAYMSDAERGLCTDIARQLLAYDEGDGLDVVFGGGYGEFVGADHGGKRRDPAANLIDGWLAGAANRRFVRRADELGALQPGQQVLGLFANSHLEYVVRRPPDTAEPTLRQMTLRALELLSARDGGYFLLVEGGRIDHGHHIGRAGFALTEAQAFAETVAAVLDRVDLDDTL